MSRLKATLARSPVDREIVQQTDIAERALRTALRACEKTPAETPEVKRRVEKTRQDLLRTLGALSAVHRVHPIYDLEPDPVVAVKKPPQPTPPPKVVATKE